MEYDKKYWKNQYNLIKEIWCLEPNREPEPYESNPQAAINNIKWQFNISEEDAIKKLLESNEDNRIEIKGLGSGPCYFWSEEY